LVFQAIKKWISGKDTARPAPSLAPPPALLERYRLYKRLLAANSLVLAILADLQAKRTDGFLFDMHYVKSACERLGQEVEILVASLVAMSEGRYAGLEDARRNVAGKIEAELAVAELKPGPVALPLKEVREGLFFGGKAEKLGELTRLGLPVPRGFGVSAYAQKLFFEAAGLEEFIRESITRINIRDLESFKQAGQLIRERILAAALPGELQSALDRELQALGAKRVSVRSSALQEDSTFSFAGQFETALNVQPERVADRYKEIIASLFTPRALYYCHSRGFSYQELAMGVLVMEMVESRAAGVLYTADPRGGEAATIINAVFGLGSLAVGGHVEPDVYRLKGREVVGRQVGGKALMHILAPAGGVTEAQTPLDLQESACLNEAQLLELAALGAGVEEHFGLPQDLEWALSPEGNFLVLQARPLAISQPLKAEAHPRKLKGVPALLDTGAIASRGAAAGVVYVLEEGPVLEVPKGAVLVTRRALSEYGLVADRVAALVSEAGSATSHLATVLREAEVPAIFGARDATRILKTGQLVTVDAMYGNIYPGRQEEVLKTPAPDPALKQSRAWKVLERVLKHITPLHLLDPRAENFKPAHCTSYHDITRFAHEKAMIELFQVSDRISEEAGARRLKSNIPVEIFVIDLGGGLVPEAAHQAVVRPEDLASRPMLAYWRGVTAIGWRGPKPVDFSGFMSVVMGSAAGDHHPEALQEKNFAIISQDYLNLSNRLGFHFATVDAYLGTPEDSYVSLTFYGGGAEIVRRMRRVHFMARVLEHLDFRVELKEDSLIARVDGFDLPALEAKLEILGRLMMVTKQMDMVMLSDEAVNHYYHEFISQGYNLNF
jgi:pyruvate,water dikinase